MFRRKEATALEQEIMQSIRSTNHSMEIKKLEAAFAERKLELRQFSEQKPNFTSQEASDRFRNQCHAIMDGINTLQDQLDKLTAESRDSVPRP